MLGKILTSQYSLLGLPTWWYQIKLENGEVLEEKINVNLLEPISGEGKNQQSQLSCVLSVTLPSGDRIELKTKEGDTYPIKVVENPEPAI